MDSPAGSKSGGSQKSRDSGIATCIFLPSVSIAATVIYAYAWLVPLALWGFLVWRNSKVMNIVSYSFLEIVCVYGYSLFIYIPTAVSTTLTLGEATVTQLASLFLT